MYLELSPRDHPDCPLVSICHSFRGEVAVPARRQPMPMTAIGIVELLPVTSDILNCPQSSNSACVVRVIVRGDVGTELCKKSGAIAIVIVFRLQRY